jgi:hypothetical protein
MRRKALFGFIEQGRTRVQSSGTKKQPGTPVSEPLSRPAFTEDDGQYVEDVTDE